MKTEKVYAIQSTEVQRVQEDNGNEVLKVGVTLLGMSEKVFNPLRSGDRVAWYEANGWSNPPKRRTGSVMQIFENGMTRVYEDGWQKDPVNYIGVNVPVQNLKRLVAKRDK